MKTNTQKNRQRVRLPDVKLGRESRKVRTEGQIGSRRQKQTLRHIHKSIQALIEKQRDELTG